MNLATSSVQLFLLAMFVVTLVLSFGISTWFKRYALKKNITDLATLDPTKKKHIGAIPLVVGSGAVLLSALIMLIPAASEQLGYGSYFNYTSVPNWASQTLAFIAATLVLLAGGYVDDKYRVKPITQLCFVTVAILLVILSGVRIGVSWDWLFSPEIWSLLVTSIWLYICAASTKFLDGHDGLVASVTSIGLLGIASVALIDRIQQPLYAVFALVWAFAIAGFLPYNFPKAKAYLGEGASIAFGFAIGYFSLVVGSKVLVANAVLGLFLLDLMYVWFLRILDKRNFLTSADRLHWHHRLLDLGLDKLQVVIITTIIVLINVHIAIWFALNQNSWISIIQVGVFIGILSVVSLLPRNKKTNP
jgi:UDP-GlcNAc:undecaprenyl-phosphate/decaprenyl-phosphate GlcNAc-1-phosphate transferase